MPKGRAGRRQRAATLVDVGRAAGVSAMAASAVLNHARTSSRISPETREKILLAAERLHYRPNAAARALVARRMHTIGLAAVFSRPHPNFYMLDVLDGVLEAAGRLDQNTTVFALSDWDAGAGRLHDFCDGRIDGMLLIAPRLSPEQVEKLPSHTPFVFVHGSAFNERIVNIESDDETGAYDIVRHLISLGHRRILHVTGDRGLVESERRIHGYRRALESAGVPFDNAMVLDSEFGPESGRASIERWFANSRRKPLPQAIFCASDATAVACMEILAAAGIRVPDDVSVVGFDDSTAARTTVPQLTTVQQPLRTMGARAVETLIALIDRRNESDSAEANERIIFPTRTIIRQSSGPPPERQVYALRV